jgi:hypothetical protein
LLLHSLEPKKHHIGVHVRAFLLQNNSTCYLIKGLVLITSLKIVWYLNSKHKNLVFMCHNRLVTRIRVNIWILIVSGPSQSINAKGDEFVFQKSQKQVLECPALDNELEHLGLLRRTRELVFVSDCSVQGLGSPWSLLRLPRLHLQSSLLAVAAEW